MHKTQDADKEAWDVLWEEQEELDKEEAKKVKVRVIENLNPKPQTVIPKPQAVNPKLKP